MSMARTRKAARSRRRQPPAPRIKMAGLTMLQVAEAVGGARGADGVKGALDALIAAVKDQEFDDMILVEPLVERKELVFHEAMWALIELGRELREHYDKTDPGQRNELLHIVTAVRKQDLVALWTRTRLYGAPEVTIETPTRTLSLQFLSRALARVTASAA
jgi:hypothetical protein